MRCAIDDGWLTGGRRVLSPHCDARPPGVEIDALIVHGITLPPGRFGHKQVERFFTQGLDTRAHPFYATISGLRVSAHLLIERTGVLTQFVSFDDRAWHAGVSSLEGREAVNDFAVGIELEGTDDCPYAPAQYVSLAHVAAALLDHYPALERTRIVGHSDIAPGRKTDPGPAFDWGWFDRCLKDCTPCT